MPSLRRRILGGESNETGLSQLDVLSVLCNLLLFAIQVNVAYISNNPLLVDEQALPLADVCWLVGSHTTFRGSGWIMPYLCIFQSKFWVEAYWREN